MAGQNKEAEQRQRERGLLSLLQHPDLGLSEPCLSPGGQVTGVLVGLLGFEDGRAALAGSAWERLVLGQHSDAAKRSRADIERAQMTASCASLLRARRLCVFSEPVGRGGLLGRLAQLCRSTSIRLGCAVVVPAPRTTGTADSLPIEQQLFHEAEGRFVVGLPATQYAEAMLLTASEGIPLLPLGRLGGKELVVRASAGSDVWDEVLRVSLEDLVATQQPGANRP
jgi:hypothetical protein